MLESGGNPIGVFDSGLGGLTILKALKMFLPNEQFIYCGDTARLPYGEKSEENLTQYVSEISQFLYNEGCKILVVACNSASTVIHKVPNLPFDSHKVIDVIQPIVSLMGAQKRFKNIGVIGTRKTIDSNIFQNEILNRNDSLNVISRKTPILVPAIEEGFTQEKFLFPIFDRYFKDFENIEVIIPACTHYPLIYEQIENYFQHQVKVLHTPKIIAEYVQDRLSSLKLENTLNTTKNTTYYLSDLTENFQKEAEMFLGETIYINKVDFKSFSN